MAAQVQIALVVRACNLLARAKLLAHTVLFGTALMCALPRVCIASAIDAAHQASPARLTEVPDPATPFLVGAGLVTVSIIMRRRRKSSRRKSPPDTPVQ
jgi:hypothetical protein